MTRRNMTNSKCYSDSIEGARGPSNPKQPFESDTDDLGGEPLDDSGFEEESPDRKFEEGQ